MPKQKHGSRLCEQQFSALLLPVLCGSLLATLGSTAAALLRGVSCKRG